MIPNAKDYLTSSEKTSLRNFKTIFNLLVIRNFLNNGKKKSKEKNKKRNVKLNSLC